MIFVKFTVKNENFWGVNPKIMGFRIVSENTKTNLESVINKKLDNNTTKTSIIIRKLALFPSILTFFERKKLYRFSSLNYTKL